MSHTQASIWHFFGLLGVIAFISAFQTHKERPVPTDPHLPTPKPIAERGRQKPWYRRWRTLVLIVNLATLGALVWYAYLTRQINETGQRQLAATERPWIRAQIVPTSDLTFDEKGDAHLTVVVATKNVGHSVASGIATRVALISTDNYFNGPIERQRKLCEEVARIPFDRGKGYILFPGDDGSEPQSGLSAASNEIQRSRLPIENKPGKNALFFLVGCVDYGYFGLPAHHQTGFVYDVLCLNPKEPNHPSAIEIGRTWNTQSLILIPHSFGGGYAD